MAAHVSGPVSGQGNQEVSTELRAQTCRVTAWSRGK